MLAGTPVAPPQLDEFFCANEAHLRAEENYLIIANMRGDDPAAIAQALFTQPELSGLQGPTIAPVYTRNREPYHSVSIVVRKSNLVPAVRALRSVGGSGVIVTPVTYIFEEEPPRYKTMVATLQIGGNHANS